MATIPLFLLNLCLELNIYKYYSNTGTSDFSSSTKLPSSTPYSDINFIPSSTYNCISHHFHPHILPFHFFHRQTLECTLLDIGKAYRQVERIALISKKAEYSFLSSHLPVNTNIIPFIYCCNECKRLFSSHNHL